MRKALSLTFFILGVLIFQSSSFAAHPYGQEFESEVSEKFLNNGAYSIDKIENYKIRIEQKLREITGFSGDNFLGNGLLVTKYKDQGLSGTELERKIKKQESYIALNLALNSLTKMISLKTVSDEFFSEAYNVLDLEHAIRIAGQKGSNLTEVIKNVTTRWRVPLVSQANMEASNLYNPKTMTYLSVDQIAEIKKQQGDLSLYSPKINHGFWQKRKDISKLEIQSVAKGEGLEIYKGVKIKFPEDNTFYFDEVKRSDTKPKLDVYSLSKKGKKRKFKLKLGGELHADPTASSLMMALGYPVDITKYAKKVKVYIGDNSVEDLVRDWEIYIPLTDPTNIYKLEDYIMEAGTDEGGSFVIFKEGLIEAKPKELERLGGWSYGHSAHKSFREVRGLNLVNLWLDNSDAKDFDNNRLILKEKKNGTFEKYHIISDPGSTFGNLFAEVPDLYFWDIITKRTKKDLVFSYRSIQTAGNKNQITFDDAKWATRLISKLTRRQITDAVRLARWPFCVGNIYIEKIIHRRNELVKHFDLINEVDSDGNTIDMLPVNGTREQWLLRNACNLEELSKSSTIDYDFYNYDFLLGPLNEMAWKKILNIARKQLNSLDRITISSANLGLDLGLISEVIIDPKREFERNPNPTSLNDIYIAKESLKVGFRLGGGYGAFADMVVSKQYSITYPVKSSDDILTKNNFVVNLFLPSELKQGHLPEKYVVSVEQSLEFRAGIQARNIGFPLGAELGKNLSGNLWRVVYDNRNPQKQILYRERTKIDEKLFFNAFVPLGVLRISFFDTMATWGRAKGEGAVFSHSDLQSLSLNNIDVTRSVLKGNFLRLSELEKDFDISNRISKSHKKLDLYFYAFKNSNNYDEIEFKSDNRVQNVLQYKTSRKSSWSFFGDGEEKTRDVLIHYNTNLENPTYTLELGISEVDRNTSDEELLNNINFSNTLSSETILPFSPDLGYSTNGVWGEIVFEHSLFYNDTAVRRILELSKEEFWNSIPLNSEILEGSTPKEMYEKGIYYNELKANSLTRSRARKTSGLSSNQVAFIYRVNKFFYYLKKAQKTKTLRKHLTRLAKALRKAVYHKSGEFKPYIIEVLNHIVGSENIYNRALIDTPLFVEKNLIEGVRLEGEAGQKVSNNSAYFIFEAEGPIESYNLFDSWPID